LVKTCFNRIFPISSLSFFSLPWFVIFALNYASISLIFLKTNCFEIPFFFYKKNAPSPLWKMSGSTSFIHLKNLLSDNLFKLSNILMINTQIWCIEWRLQTKLHVFTAKFWWTSSLRYRVSLRWCDPNILSLVVL
jgi:hypothetical protein